MSLKTGDWTLKGNGFEGVLTIRSIDAQGHVDGNVDNDLLEGYWDDKAHNLVFTSMNLSNSSTMRIFTGSLLSYALLDMVMYRLVGSVETITVTGTSIQRVVDGWFAQTGGGIVR